MLGFFLALTLLFTIWGLVGCAHQADKVALGFEKALVAGSAAVDTYVNETINDCIDKDLQTEAERAKCVEKAEKAAIATEKAMTLAVEGLRTYWAARAKNDSAAMMHGLSLIKQAVALLPPEHFAGLGSMLKGK